jgi:hypothetical protein
VVTFALIGLGLIELLCLWVPQTVPSLSYDEALVLSGALGTLAAASVAPALFALRRGSTDIVGPLAIFGLSNLVYGVLGNLMVFADPETLLAGEQSLKYFGVAVIYITLAFAAFALGSRIPAGGSWTAAPPQWKVSRIPLAVGILVCMAWGIRLYAMSQGLVMTKLIDTPAREYLGNPILVALYFRSRAVAWLAIAICIIAAVRYSRGSRRTTSRWTIAAVVLAGLEIVYGAVIQLSRMELVGLGLVITVVLFCCGRRLPARPVAVFLTVCVLFVMPFVAISRSIQSPMLMTSPDVFERFGMFVSDVMPATLEIMATDYVNSYVGTIGHSTRLSSADVLAAMVQKSWEEGVEPAGLFGLLRPFVALVPRAIWPDKPDLETTMVLQDHYGFGWYGWGDPVDVIVTPFNEAYGFLGLPGALLVMGLIGFIFRLMHRYLVANSNGQWSTGIAVYSVLVFEMVFSTNTVSGVFAPFRDMIILSVFLAVVLEGRLPFVAAPRSIGPLPGGVRGLEAASRSGP